jgi:hypothetical protein
MKRSLGRCAGAFIPTPGLPAGLQDHSDIIGDVGKLVSRYIPRRPPLDSRLAA